MGLGLAVLRGVIGGLHVGHGAQKLFGSFGGGGPEGTGMFFESAGLRPGKPMAQLAGASEVAGGALLALGALTPLAAAMLDGVHVVAYKAVHADKGVWATSGGYEYNLTIVAALTALVDAGPGPISVDAALGGERAGLGWALLSLAAGVAGGAGVLAYGTRQGSGQPGGGPTEAATGGA